MTPERAASEFAYDGVLYPDLSIESIDWSEAEAHIRTRATRKDYPDEFNVEPEWATEAVFDPGRVVGDSGSRSGESIKVIGYSEGAGRFLVVILVPKSHPPTGDWWGASAWAANDRDERSYQQGG